jgi:hypothetical protein
MAHATYSYGEKGSPEAGFCALKESTIRALIKRKKALPVRFF